MLLHLLLKDMPSSVGCGKFAAVRPSNRPPAGATPGGFRRTRVFRAAQPQLAIAPRPERHGCFPNDHYDTFRGQILRSATWNLVAETDFPPPSSFALFPCMRKSPNSPLTTFLCQYVYLKQVTQFDDELLKRSLS